jgi:hypothetical protein
MYIIPRSIGAPSSAATTRRLQCRSELTGFSFRGNGSPCAWFLLTVDNYVASGSIRLGSLFLTFPTRVLTGQQVIPPEG